MTSPIPPEFDRALWVAHEETIRGLAECLEPAGLRLLIDELRPPDWVVDEDGLIQDGWARGRWASLLTHPDLDNRRQVLLYDLVELHEAKVGAPWPFPADTRPNVPDTPEGLDRLD